MPRLLIIEDQSSLREVLKVVFENEFEVRAAGDGFEALEIMGVWQPDVIITDYAMPGMTGMELIQRIENRELSNKSNKRKIILFSACFTDEIKQQARDLGVAACVDKPFDLDELRRILR